MSSTFVELGLIVLAAFGLGLFVGWLAWSTVPVEVPGTGGANRAGSSVDASPGAADPDAAWASSDDDGLPHWWAEQVPTAELQLRAHRFRPRKRGPTVVVRPRGWTSARRR